MEYKVSDKVKSKGDSYFNKGEVVEIIKIDEYCRSVPYFCEGKTKSAWQCESDLDPLDNHLTFQQKLYRFKREPIGFLVKSKEIADELAKVFTREGMVGELGSSADDIMYSCINDNGDSSTPWVSYNYTDGARGLSYGLSDGSSKNLSELLDITLEELKEYNSTQQLTITITSDGYHRVTAESNGKTAEALCNSTDTFDVAEGARLAIQRLTAEEPKDEPMFHKGDLVEVIGDCMLTKGAIGLQGVVMENDDAPLVTLVTRVNHSDCWSFKQEDLKLIRRANV